MGTYAGVIWIQMRYECRGGCNIGAPKRPLVLLACVIRVLIMDKEGLVRRLGYS